MRQTLLLVAVLASGCGTFFNVGDNGTNQDDLTTTRPCGPNTCAPGLVCCNESCGICTPPDGFCTQQACAPVDAGSCAPVVCTLACEHGFEVDADGCQICACKPPPPVQCGPNTCAAGELCCNESCGICTPPDGACTQQLCSPLDGGSSCPPVVCTLACQYGFADGPDGCPICACKPPPGPVRCGWNTCAEGELCCNESCGICTPPDGVCTQQACAPADGGSGQPCGFNTCAPGTVCCNPSCGVCTPPGFACTQEVCACAPVVCTLACQHGFKRGADGCELCECAPPPVTCGDVTCGAGLECCNASCGICTPPGQACTQQACN